MGAPQSPPPSSTGLAVFGDAGQWWSGAAVDGHAASTGARHLPPRLGDVTRLALKRAQPGGPTQRIGGVPAEGIL